MKSDLKTTAIKQALEFCEFLWREVALNDYAEGQRERVEAALRAALEQAEQTGGNAERLLRDALVDAQWCDKWIYPVYGKNYQNWKIEIYLPVPESAKDKSAEAALKRVLTEKNT